MKKQEAGFTYPFTLMVFLLFLLFFSARIDGMLVQRKTAHESSKIFQEEYYFLTSIKKIEEIYLTGKTIPPKDTIPYLNGAMEYQSEQPVNNLQIVNFTLKLSSGETVIGRGYFDLISKHLYKWQEK